MSEVLPSMQELLDRAYKQGRTDALNDVSKYIFDEFVKQNSTESKFKWTIVLDKKILIKLDQMIKEQGNGD